MKEVHRILSQSRIQDAPLSLNDVTSLFRQFTQYLSELMGMARTGSPLLFEVSGSHPKLLIDHFQNEQCFDEPDYPSLRVELKAQTIEVTPYTLERLHVFILHAKTNTTPATERMFLALTDKADFQRLNAMSSLFVSGAGFDLHDQLNHSESDEFCLLSMRNKEAGRFVKAFNIDEDQIVVLNEIEAQLNFCKSGANAPSVFDRGIYAPRSMESMLAFCHRIMLDAGHLPMTLPLIDSIGLATLNGELSVAQFETIMGQSFASYAAMVGQATGAVKYAINALGLREEIDTDPNSLLQLIGVLKYSDEFLLPIMKGQVMANLLLGKRHHEDSTQPDSLSYAKERIRSAREKHGR